MINSTTYFVTIWGLFLLWIAAALAAALAGLVRRSWRFSVVAVAIFAGGFLMEHALRVVLF